MQRWANDDLRSLNGQIEFLLQKALLEAGRYPKFGKGKKRRDGDKNEP